VLGEHPIYVVLLSRDLGETRRFYHDTLGLPIISESDAAISFRSGHTVLDVTKSTTGTADTQTQATWIVDDLHAEVEALRDRGVAIQDYDLPGLKTDDGIADIGFANAAWIIDPHGNALGILQLKN
jgi:catechol-2,3-dioxygenase